MGFDDSNHILLMSFIKSMSYLTFLATNMKLTFSWKITEQGGVPPFKAVPYLFQIYDISDDFY